VMCMLKNAAAAGAPDPTAGGALDDDNSWHLDEEQVQKLVKNYLSQGIYCNHNEHLSSIFDKVQFMQHFASAADKKFLSGDNNNNNTRSSIALLYIHVQAASSYSLTQSLPSTLLSAISFLRFLWLSSSSVVLDIIISHISFLIVYVSQFFALLLE